MGNVVTFDFIDAVGGAVLSTHCCYESDLPNIVAPTGQTVRVRVLQSTMPKEINYVGARAASYPPIGDQLDVLWKVLATTPERLSDEAREMIAQINAVKTAYPKTDTFVVRVGEKGVTYTKKG